LINIDQLLQSAAEAAGRVERPAGKCADLAQIAAVYLQRGEKDLGLEMLKAALEAADRIKQPGEKAGCLAGMAALLVRAGDTPRANETFTRALLLARAAESAEKQAEALATIAAEYIAAGLGEEAAGVLAAFYVLVKAPDNGLDTACELIEIAGMYLEIKRPEMAEQMLKEAIESVQMMKDPWLKVERLISAAEMYASMENHSSAANTLGQAEAALAGILPVDRVDFWLRIAQVYSVGGNEMRTLDGLTEALKSTELNEEACYQAESLAHIAEVYFDLGKADMALERLEHSRQKSLQVEDPRDRVAVWARNAGILGQGGYKTEALELAGAALDLSRTVEAGPGLYVMGSLAVVYAGLGERDRAAGAANAIIGVVEKGGVKTAGLGAIAVELCEAGDPESAVRLADLIKDPHTRAATLAEIAVGIVEKQ
jgi:tetratricopeptide (TPR) repeat protein